VRREKMQMLYDPDEYESVQDYRPCPLHEKNPGMWHAGCTCSVGYTSRKRAPEEVAAIKERKRIAEEDRILAEADAIRARRASSPTTGAS
jgi:hypothetical protein